MNPVYYLFIYDNIFEFLIQVYIGTVQGDIMVMDLHGNPVTRVELSTDLSILNLTWNCEKFNMEERDDSPHQLTENRLQVHQQKTHMLKNNTLLSYFAFRFANSLKLVLGLNYGNHATVILKKNTLTTKLLHFLSFNYVKNMII